MLVLHWLRSSSFLKVNLRNMAEEEFEVVHCKPELPNFMGEEEVEDVQCKSEVFMNHDGAEVISCEPELRNNIDEKEVEAAKSELAFASVDVSMGTSNTEDTFFIPVKCEPEWKSENEEEPFSDFKDEISDEEDRTPNNFAETTVSSSVEAAIEEGHKCATGVAESDLHRCCVCDKPFRQFQNFHFHSHLLSKSG
ncbi:uncharacterized protein [Anabrus simplex]|uniref:uncharacterized protein isoform X4 n=1 Tax=Anabrus simplex TaxID=316456 RepID=UPI0035A26A80